MLVLTRRLNERIVIGDNVRITVVGIRGNHVRLGIEAPPKVTVLRDELLRHTAKADAPEPSHRLGVVQPKTGLREAITSPVPCESH